MNILVIGGGGREHAIIQKLKEDPRVEKIFALPGNGGIAADAVCLGGSAVDIPAAVAAARDNNIDFVAVAPDDPLVLGMVDALEAEGFPCFGPRKNAAIIEGSKAFSKDLMKKYGIPTAAYETFTDLSRALAYVEACPLPTVVKADGLALGKGVTVDTGGYSLKARDSMEGIKGDMAGAAAAACALRALAAAGTRVNAVAVIPTCENRISRESAVPGDVIRSLSGQTIEILNTDAEGRLILADGLTWAVREEKCTRLVDAATLTGAIWAMLGYVTAGVMASDDGWYGRLEAAAALSGYLSIHLAAGLAEN